MGFVKWGDIMMPSVALTAARFSAKYGRGNFGSNLFANMVVDPTKQDSNGIVVYFDTDKEKSGGNVRVLRGAPTWVVEQMIVSSSALNSGDANMQCRQHVNFLCSVRGVPVQCEEDKLWYRLIHISLVNNPRRVGKTGGGMELYEAMLQIKWRPMSTSDSDYESVTGISIT